MKFGIFSDTAIGYINLYDISHKDFLYLKEANITSDEVTEEQMDAIKTSLEDVCDQNASKYQDCNVSVNKKNVVMKANASIKDLYSEFHKYL